MGFNETRELSQIEDKIHAAEAKLLQLQAEAEKPEIQSSASKLTELYQSISEAQIEVERLYERWTELEAMKSN
jgi:phage shock protein A